MIAKVSGILAHKQPGQVIVDVGGVGYQVFISLGDFYHLPESGRPVSLYIHTHLTEETIQLFGFLESSEKQVFLSLKAVAGIGPKLAMNILSGIPAEELTRALREEDQPRLLSIPGVGKRLAERMIVELRDRLVALPSVAGDGWGQDSELIRDATSALLNLGYRRAEAEKTVRQVVTEGVEPLENVLKEALQRLSQ